MSEATINLKLKKKPSTYVEPDVVYAEAQKILDKITNSDMSDMEKALQITYWVRYNVYYVSNCDDSSWTRAAYDGFTKRSGNCYTFAMCAKALFDVAGIENMIIIRDPDVHETYIKFNRTQILYHFFPFNKPLFFRTFGFLLCLKESISCAIVV